MKFNLIKIFIIKFTFILLFFIISSISLFSIEKTVILISLDGFRYDYLFKGNTPTLDKIALDGVHAAYLQPSFPSSTFPNHLSIITGMYPENHGIIANEFKEYSTGKAFSLMDSSKFDVYWYNFEPIWLTCKKNKIITASYFWPGSDINDINKNPNYFKVFNPKIENRERINTVLKWLDTTDLARPKFITIYFDDPDVYGHKYGTQSTEFTDKLKFLDREFAYFIESLKHKNYLDSINLIIVSDHGMIDIEEKNVIDIHKILPKEYADIMVQATFCLVQPKKGKRDFCLDLLKINKSHFDFYLRDSMPRRFRYNKNQRISDIVVLAEQGWTFSWKSGEKNNYKAIHGYDNKSMEMQGIFLALGPDFKKKYKCSGLINVDIYPLICKIFGIEQRNGIDGFLNRIIHVLQNQ